MLKPECLFCQMVQGAVPAHVIWESETHLAFLSIFPNTEGFSVVIPKVHVGSYVFEAPDEVMASLMVAAKHVAMRLDHTFDDVGRTGIMFEGFGVDHLHAKLFPMHGTKTDEWRKRSVKGEKYFDQYEGYLSSQDYERADDEVLAALAKRLRESAL